MEKQITERRKMVEDLGLDPDEHGPRMPDKPEEPSFDKVGEIVAKMKAEAAEKQNGKKPAAKKPNTPAPAPPDAASFDDEEPIPLVPESEDSLKISATSKSPATSEILADPDDSGALPPIDKAFSDRPSLLDDSEGDGLLLDDSDGIGLELDDSQGD